jgi:tetratricopeptide (TPR) repeat protein
MSPEDVAAEDRARLAEAWIESAWVRFCDGGSGARALALLERGLEVAVGEAARGAHALEARAHAYRIRICHLDGAIGRATESARRVAELATAAGERFGVVFGIGNEGYVRCDAGEIEDAHRLCTEAYALAREARHEVALALAAAWLAKVHVFRGDCEAALRSSEEARELGVRSGQVSAVYNADMWAGMALLLQNEPKRGAECLERLASTNGRWPTTLDWLALARLETGRFDEAAEMARRCLAAAPPRLVRLRALRTLGLALGLGSPADRDPAERALAESLTLAAELDLRPHLADAHLALAELCRRHGDERRAAYYAERARRTWEACGMPLHAALARAEG